MTSERIVRNPEPSLAISARLCDRQARGFVRAHPVKVHKERTAVSLLAFSDDPIAAQSTPIKAVHFTELRTAINARRAARGLAPFAWTDPALGLGHQGRSPERASDRRPSALGRFRGCPTLRLYRKGLVSSRRPR